MGSKSNRGNQQDELPSPYVIMAAGTNRYVEFMEEHSSMFPWGSDSDTEPQGSELKMQPKWGLHHRATLGAEGVHIREIPYEKNQAGKVLHHCLDAIASLRSATGGDQLALFKIGITHDYHSRLKLYRERGWQKMLVMFSSPELGQIEMLEASLILHFRGLQQCRNICKGGEGMRTSSFTPKFNPPYVCYCVAARADCGHSVL